MSNKVRLASTLSLSLEVMTCQKVKAITDSKCGTRKGGKRGNEKTGKSASKEKTLSILFIDTMENQYKIWRHYLQYYIQKTICKMYNYDQFPMTNKVKTCNIRNLVTRIIEWPIRQNSTTMNLSARKLQELLQSSSCRTSTGGRIVSFVADEGNEIEITSEIENHE